MTKAKGDAAQLQAQLSETRSRADETQKTLEIAQAEISRLQKLSVKK
jgi:chromosome condensin MukBEF ATPase and DNA-binding subunit MukB